jgi:GNAT superfamily N-acetyltransferase
MSTIIYRLATVDDVEALAMLRAEFLGEISKKSGPHPELIDALKLYFMRALPTGEFAAYLAEADGSIVATSGFVYYRHPPSFKNMGGCEGYVMNMYTLPKWRGQGIGTILLGKLIEHSRQNNCCRISLHAMPEAQPLYRRMGFVHSEGEMRLDLRDAP